MLTHKSHNIKIRSFISEVSSSIFLISLFAFSKSPIIPNPKGLKINDFRMFI